MSLDLTRCPDCGAPAEVEWRAVMESTDGPVEHARLRCLHGHWYLLPVASLAEPGGRLVQGGSHRTTSFRE
jgi:hypothetical protein